jgi:hypothetical protein
VCHSTACWMWKIAQFNNHLCLVYSPLGTTYDQYNYFSPSDWRSFSPLDVQVVQFIRFIPPQFDLAETCHHELQPSCYFGKLCHAQPPQRCKLAPGTYLVQIGSPGQFLLHNVGGVVLSGLWSWARQIIDAQGLNVVVATTTENFSSCLDPRHIIRHIIKYIRCLNRCLASRHPFRHLICLDRCLATSHLARHLFRHLMCLIMCLIMWLGSRQLKKFPVYCDNSDHQVFTLTQCGSVGKPLLQPQNRTSNGYWHITHLEGNGYTL